MGAQWLTVIYSLLTCFGGGVLVFLGVSELMGIAPKTRRAAAIAAALLLLAGGCVFVGSLGHPGRINGRGHQRRQGGSQVSLQFVCAVACLVAAIVYAVVSFRDEEGGTTAKVVGAIGLVLGVLMAVAAGCSNALGRAVWSSIVLPVAYFGGGIAMGGSLFLRALIACLHEDASDIRKLLWATLAGALLQAVGFVAAGACSGFAFDAMLYWVGAIAVGTVVPIACLVLSSKVQVLVFAALAGSAVGAVCLRVAMFSLGTTSLQLIANAASRVAL